MCASNRPFDESHVSPEKRFDDVVGLAGRGGLAGAQSAPPPPRRNSGLCHVCTGGKQHKAQKENGLVSGL